MSSSAPFSLTSTLLSQPLHRAQTHPLSPSLHNKASSWSCLPAASSLVSLLPAMQPEGPCEDRSQVMSLPCSGPPVAPSQVKALCLVAHGTPHNPTGQHAPCRGCRFYQGSGKIPHAARQLSLCTPTGAHMPQSPRSTMRSQHIATREEPPLSSTKGNPRAATKTQGSQK